MDVLNKRQNNLTVVLENVFDPHNISAVMRTCDAVGIGEIYVLNTRIPPHKKWGRRSSSSAAKWLTIHQFDNNFSCLQMVRGRFKKVLAGHLSESSADLYQLDFKTSTALVFGNEHDGVSKELRSLCDGDFIIPQVGMIRSLNISVACAVTLYEAFRQKREAGHFDQPGLTPKLIEQFSIQWGNDKDPDSQT